MAGKNLWQNKCEMGATEEYFTEFKWVLKHWTLLYDSTYQYRIDSPAFELNGTDGYTCRVSLDMKQESPLIIEFSSTLHILAMKITNSLNNIETHNNFFTGPIERESFMFNVSLIKGSPNYIFKHKDCSEDTITILVNIMIIKSVVSTESLNKTVMSLKKSTNDLSQRSNNSSMNILSEFKTMLDSQTLCDITFVVGANKFPAHKTVLAAHSKVFEAMFVSPLGEQDQNNVEISDTEADVFKEFLNYLYTGQGNNIETMVEKMIFMADYYQVDDLKTVCEDCFLEKLCEENVVKYAVIADKFCCNALKDRAIDLIRNSQKVLERAFIEENFETLKCLKEILSSYKN